MDRDDLPGADAVWSLAKARTEAGILLIRRNQSAAELLGHPTLGIKLGFAIPFKEPPQSDLPNATENEQVGELEDQIIEAVEQGTTGIHVLTLTDPVCKELIFYIEPGADIAAIHEDLMAKITSHEVQCMAEHDADWNFYRHFSPEQD